MAASPDSGVNTLTGEGLAEAMTDASVVVDVSDSPFFEDAAILPANRWFPEASGELGEEVLGWEGTGRR